MSQQPTHTSMHNFPPKNANVCSPTLLLRLCSMPSPVIVDPKKYEGLHTISDSSNDVRKSFLNHEAHRKGPSHFSQAKVRRSTNAPAPNISPGRSVVIPPSRQQTTYVSVSGIPGLHHPHFPTVGAPSYNDIEFVKSTKCTKGCQSSVNMSCSKLCCENLAGLVGNEITLFQRVSVCVFVCETKTFEIVICSTVNGKKHQSGNPWN